MNRLLLSLFLTIAASFAAWASTDRTYRYEAFASEETQKSLEVSEAQSAELLASRKKSDMIAFATVGGILALVIAIAESKKLTALILIAPILGIVGGAIGAQLGHFQDAQMRLEGNQVTYWFARWTAILIPIGLACGGAAQLTSRTKGVNGIVAGVLSACAASLVYCFLSGAVTPIENRQEIFPAHSFNRLLVISAIGILTALLVNMQLRDKTNSTEKADFDKGS